MKETSMSRFTNLFSKQRTIFVAAAILLLPLLFMGTHTSSDWGDDFAQYIHQAGNIINGIPQSETGYIYNQLNYIGPQAYPIGFPLLLVPVYAIAGNNMVAFTTFMSLIYIIMGLLMVIFYKKYFSWISALVLTFIYIYNPQMILFKREIMSDIPFTALLILNFILYQKLKTGNIKQLIALSLLTGFMLVFRPAGIVFIAAVVMEQTIFLFRRKASLKNSALRSGIFILIPVIMYFLFNSLIFKIPSGGSVRDYLLFYNSGKLFQIIPENLATHIEVFRYLYIPEAGILKGFSLLFGAVMLTFTLVGFLKRLFERPDVMEWFFIFYMIMLLIFPNNNSAFRLMIPLGFITLFYAATGLKSIQLMSGMATWKKAVVPGIFVLVLFIPGIFSIVRSQNNILEGPQRKSSIEAFSYIRSNIPSEAVIVFAKPRALALYAGCHSLADPYITDQTLLHLQIVNAKATYILLNSALTEGNMLRYAGAMKSRLTRQWENKEFVLYKINPVNP